MGKKKSSVSINVYARFCPLLKQHSPIANKNLLLAVDSHGYSLKISDDGKSVAYVSVERRKQAKNVNLDMILGSNTSQEQMFSLVGGPVIEDVLHGYNGTIFTYGQTGSGKTYSLFGDISNINSDNRGIIPRACQAIFTKLAANDNILEATVKCSFLEIYMEKLQDLLNPDKRHLTTFHGSLSRHDKNSKHPKLLIRERIDKSVFVDGLHEENVSCFKDIYLLLKIGFRNRAVSSTLMNAQSSRSHCILILTIKQVFKEDGSTKMSKIHFVDLAGSERIKKTGAKGKLLEEAKKINLSLSALGNCIHSLTDKSSHFVPFRDSKLTYLLQDSLGGNTKTSMIITVSPAQYNYAETIGSLLFAQRAKTLKNNVKVNKQVSVKEMQVMITIFKRKLSDAENIIEKLKTFLVLLRKDYNSYEDMCSAIDQYLEKFVPSKLPSAIHPKRKSLRLMRKSLNVKQKKERLSVTADMINTIIDTVISTSPVCIGSNNGSTVNTSSDESTVDHETSIDNDNNNGKEELAESQLIKKEKEDCSESDSSSDAEDEISGIMEHAVLVMKGLSATIIRKDEEIAVLHSDIKQMRIDQHLAKQHIFMESAKQAYAIENEEKINENGNRNSSEMSEIEKLKAIIAEQNANVYQLTSEVEQLKNDRQHLSTYNNQLLQKISDLNEDNIELTDKLHGNKNYTQLPKRYSILDQNIAMKKLKEENEQNEKWEKLQELINSYRVFNNNQKMLHTAMLEDNTANAIESENEKLILCDMRNEWIEEITGAIQSLMNEEIGDTMHNKNEGRYRNPILKSSAILTKIENKFDDGATPSSILMDSFKQSLKLYFGGKLAILKGELMLDLTGNAENWEKVHVILTEEKCIAYRIKQRNDNKNEKQILMNVHLKRQVINVETVENDDDDENATLFVLETHQNKFGFKAIGMKTRAIWIKFIKSSVL